MKLSIYKNVLLTHLARVVILLDRDYQALKLVFDTNKNTIELETINNISKIISHAPVFEPRKEDKYLDGSFVLDGKLFYEVVKKLNENVIDIETVDNKLVLKSGKSKYNFNFREEERFTNHQVILDKTHKIVLSTLDFTNLVKSTIIACSQNDTRPILMGVCFDLKDNKLSVYASDSFRVAYNSIDMQDKNNIRIVIPQSTLNDILKISRGSEITLVIDKTKIAFEFEEFIYTSRLIEGEFPNIIGILSTASTRMIKQFSKSLLVDSLERIVLFNEENVPMVNVDFTKENIVLHSVDSQKGSAVETIQYTIFDDKNELNIACSYKYLLDALKSFNGDILNIYMSETTKPIILKQNDSNVEQLILPIRRV